MRPLIQAISMAYAVLLAVYLLLRLNAVPGWVNALHNFAPYYFVPLLVMMPLALLVRIQRGMVVALAILAVIGIAWFAPRFVKFSPVQAGNQTDTIRIVTFNTMRGEPPMQPFIAWIREINPDIIALQEMRAYHENEAVPILDALLLRYPYRNQYGYRKLFMWGNHTLTRYPMLTSDAPVYEGESLPFYVRVVVEIDGRWVALYNVHTSSPLSDDSGAVATNRFLDLAMRFDSELRNQQLERLLADLAGETLPYIVMGDFNTSDNDPMYSRLSAAMRDSFAEAGQGLGSTWPVSAERLNIPDMLPPLVRIDYVWHSDHFSAVEAAVGPRLGSDHLPLVVTLVWN